ncbi:MAG: hypothetical protein ABIX01_14985 [Chitinophagaceae bacterium]
MPVIRAMNHQQIHYISPLLMLNLDGKTSFDKKDLLLAKKKMLAELELSGGTTIDFKGKAFSKNDIVVFFDQLHQTEELAFHQAVAADTTLLHFLEGRGLLLLHRFAQQPLYLQAAFIEWISPWFAFAFSKAAKECFKKSDTEGWNYLMSLPLMMDLRHQEKCWMVLDSAMQENIEQLKELHDSGKAKLSARDEVQRIEKLCDYRLVNMMVQLPENRFASQRDEYAFDMMQVLIDLFNAQNRTYALDTLRNAKVLAHSEYMQQQLQDKYDEMQAIVRNKTYVKPGKGSTSSEWGGARAIFFFVFIIFKLITCNNEIDHSSKYDNITFSTRSQPYTMPTISDKTTAVEPPDAASAVHATDMHNPAARAMDKFLSRIFNARYSVNDSFPVQKLVNGADPYAAEWKAIFQPKDTKKYKTFPFRIENNTGVDAIIFIKGNHRVFSVYVKAKSKYITTLSEGDNTITPYLEQTFKDGPALDFTDTKTGKKVNGPGLFTEHLSYNVQWLNRPMGHFLEANAATGGHLEISDNGQLITDVFLFPY